MALLIDFITDVIEPILNKNDLVNIIKLGEEDGCFVILDWLQMLKDFDHEFLVLEICPGVVAMSVGALVVGDAEVSSEVLQEAFKEKVCIDGSLFFNWELLHHVLVFFC